MRVIAGIYKGRGLVAPKSGARPTLDRVKESLFNIVYSKLNLHGATVLDLFSGSGALGIEALSRGASHVVFVDNSRESVASIKENLAHCKVPSDAYTIIPGDYASALKTLRDRKFDLVMIDPPYGLDLCGKAVELADGLRVVGYSGLVVVEQRIGEQLTVPCGMSADVRKMGQVKLTFLTYQEEMSHNE